jgi:hypothetical protein
LTDSQVKEHFLRVTKSSVVTKRSKQAIRDADVRKSGFLEKPLELNIRSTSLVFRKRECKILINSFIIFVNIVHA